MNIDPGSRSSSQDRQPAFDPAQAVNQRGASTPPVDGPSPPYTAPYPPYLNAGNPYTGALSVNVASGLAYFTIVPAIFFLLMEPYRSNATIRFHSWQSIFYFLVVAAARAVESLLVSMLPSAVAFTIASLMFLALFTGWLMTTLKAFQGGRLHLFFIGEYAEQTARMTSAR